jgi:hypothetical protein
MTIDAPELVYSPPLPWRRRRRVRWLATLALGALIASTGPLWVPPLAGRTLMLYWQQRCLGEHVSNSTVVHEHAASEVVSGGVKRVPAHWEKLYDRISPPGLWSDGTVFLHELRSPRGTRRLVAVDVHGPPAGQARGERDLLALYYHTLEPGTVIRPPRLLQTAGYSLVIDANRGAYRIFAGIRDKNDPSHFTFDVEAAGRRTVWDGWLRDDDTVDLEERGN